MLLSLLMLPGCSPDECPPESVMGDDGLCYLEDDSGTLPDDSGTTGEWLTPPGSCDPPAAAGDPISLIGQHAVNQSKDEPWLMELTDIVLDADRGLAWGGGQGGVVAFDVSDPTDVTLSGYAPNPSENYPYGRYYHLLPHGELVYGTNRDFDLRVFDAADPAAIETVLSIEQAGLSGLAIDGDRLYVVSHTGTLHVYNIEDPRAPLEESSVDGLGNAWKIVIDGDRAFIADSSKGVVTARLSSPPTITGTIDIGGAQDLVLGDGVIYAAAGGSGIVTLDASDPDNLTVLSTLDVGTSIQSVSRDGERLWAADQESIRTLDISDPTTPTPLASKQTEQWAMHVDAVDGLAYVADWGRMSVFATDSTAAPDLDLSDDEIALSDAGETVSLTIANHGSDPLTISGISSDDDRLTLRIDRLEVAPGEAATLMVDWPGGDDLDATLCIASNDGNTPQATANVFTGIGGSFEVVGADAADFTLPGIDGNTYRLSEQLGKPVVLALFMPG